MTHLFVVDSPPGTGKTSWVLNHINKAPQDTKFFVITPLLSEIKRFKETCPDRNFVEPTFREGMGSKMNHLISLVIQGKNICSTHALLQRITDELLNALKANNYTLILDESFQVINNFMLYDAREVPDEEERSELTKQDIEWLLTENYIKVEDDYLVRWVDNQRPFGNKYQNLYNMINRQLLYMVRKKLFIWTFPYELFTEGVFKECYILTYLFKSQFQHYYFQYFNVQYETYHIETRKKSSTYQASNYQLVKTENNNHELEFKKTVRELLRVYESDKLNKVGDILTDIRKRKHETALSLNWYRNNKQLLPVIRRNMEAFFRSVKPDNSEKRLWTTFKEFKNKLRGNRGSIKNFLSFTTKATNEYSKRNVLAFMINRYPNRFYVDFFFQKGIVVNDELYALSDLLQWVWRSAIRNNEPITLFLPSQRMRNILNKYLDNIPFEEDNKNLIIDREFLSYDED